jgi:hypothetical protein
MVIVAVKLFSILMNLGKIVLQVAVIMTKLSSQYPVHCINLRQSLLKQKHFMLESKMMIA